MRGGETMMKPENEQESVSAKIDELVKKIPGVELSKENPSTQEIKQWMDLMDQKVEELNMRVARTVALVGVIQQILERKGYVSQQELIAEAVKEMTRISS